MGPADNKTTVDKTNVELKNEFQSWKTTAAFYKTNVELNKRNVKVEKRMLKRIKRMSKFKN